MLCWRILRCVEVEVEEAQRVGGSWISGTVARGPPRPWGWWAIVPLRLDLLLHDHGLLRAALAIAPLRILLDLVASVQEVDEGDE